MEHLQKKYSDRIKSAGNEQYVIQLTSDTKLILNHGQIETISPLNELILDSIKEQFHSSLTEFIEWCLSEFDQTSTMEDNAFGFNAIESAKNEIETDLSRTNRDYLYHDLRATINLNRHLVIYTFGKSYRRAAPKESQCTFNACVLNGRTPGLDIKKMNGLYLEVQRSVETSKNYDTFVSQIVQKIEADNLDCISIACTKGRHRSVSVAELLSKHVYLYSKIIHLDIR